MSMSYLKVTPAQLKSKAGEFSKDASNFNTITNQMFSLINELNGQVWSGTAATAYKKQFKELNDDTKRLVKMVKEFSNDLTAVANEYQNAETANATTAKALAKEVVTY